MFEFAVANSGKLFLTAVLAVITAGWINNWAEAMGFYSTSPWLMFTGAVMMVLFFHVWRG